MPYIVQLRMRDTRWEFATAEERDTKYDELLALAAQVGAPPENAILDKIDTQLSEFTGQVEEKRVGGTEW